MNSLATKSSTGTADANYLLDTLKDGRCKWVVALNRHLQRRLPSIHKYHHPHLFRLNNLSAHGDEPSNNESDGSTPIMPIFAVDVCHYCRSIMSVELYYIT